MSLDYTAGAAMFPLAAGRGEDPARTAAIRARDPATLEAVADQCLRPLLRAARGAGLAPARAEEAVQNAFLIFCRRAHEFDGRAKACTYLFGILVRTIAEERRRANRQAREADIDAVVEARFDSTGAWSRPPRGPDARADVATVRAWFQECLEEVPDRQRAAFVLREVEGLRTEEICNALDVTPNNLGVLLYRARHRLRECLERKGIRGSDDALV
jgi:RNA polymerase sigma-70 factor, ECF subfamily